MKLKSAMNWLAIPPAPGLMPLAAIALGSGGSLVWANA
jgi:hypothetical protein